MGAAAGLWFRILDQLVSVTGAGLQSADESAHFTGSNSSLTMISRGN
ncbi:MAG: hypothetical protein QOH41_1227 [Blastocatellia bacterium]|jgi:hypothetical protein|nr:hypothetical protein [Blastocatellia bacterium]